MATIASTSRGTGASAYMVAFFTGLQALEGKQEQFRREASDESLPETERAEAAAAFLDMSSQIAHLKDAHEAFMRDFTGPGVPPPSDAIVQRSKDLATALATEIAKKLKAAAIVRLVTQFVDAWAQLAAAGAPVEAKSAAKTATAKAKAPARSSRKTKTPRAALNTAFLKKHPPNT